MSPETREEFKRYADALSRNGSALEWRREDFVNDVLDWADDA